MITLQTPRGEVSLIPGQQAVIGRDRGCDIVLDSPGVSRRHATVRHDGTGWWLVDDASMNGVFVDGVKVISYPIDHSVTVQFGDGPQDVIRVQSNSMPGAVAPDLPEDVSRTGPSPAGVITVGRALDNSLVVGDLLASRHHARLRVAGAQAHLEDLRSFNGTYVNGRQIQQANLVEGDIVTFGDESYAWRAGALVRVQIGDGSALSADMLTFDLPDGKRLLDQISFTLEPGTLTAVIGPSGAGKSTLLRMLTGAGAPSAGRVVYAGRDLFSNYPYLRHRIGVVPQDDVIHHQLTVRRALEYAARLRFPDDVPPADRTRRVEATLGELQLQAHADTKVARLSGGQRKRTSVAMELLTEPSLLFLDEPTSGLDPGLDRTVMEMLRHLASASRTVVVITHSVANLSACDNVLVLGPGGKVAYFGPPEQVLAHFGARDYSDVFDSVAAHADHWQQLLRTSAPPRPLPPAGPVGELPEPPVQPLRRQVTTLMRRQARIMASDRSFAAFTVLLPIVLSLLVMAVPGSHGLTRPPTPSGEVTQILVILIVGATFMGMSASVRDLVNERPIYTRERAVGLAPDAYLLSKVLVFGALIAAQSAVLLAMVSIRKDMPTTSLVLGSGTLELFIACATTAFVGALLGLLISSVVGTGEQVMPLLVVAVMTQLVLCGGLIPVAGRDVLAQLALIAPAHWGYAAAASSVGALDTVAVPGLNRLWDSHASTWIFDLAACTLLGLIFIAVTYRQLQERRRAPAAAGARGRWRR